MKVDKCLKTILCVDDDIPVGSWLKSKGGNWHLVVNKKGEGYTQPTLGMSVQSQNYPKSKERIYIFNGHFLNIFGVEEIYILYKEMYIPTYTHVQSELLDSFNWDY